MSIANIPTIKQFFSDAYSHGNGNNVERLIKKVCENVKNKLVQQIKYT